jgi:hypothetical protein
MKGQLPEAGRNQKALPPSSVWLAASQAALPFRLPTGCLQVSSLSVERPRTRTPIRSVPVPHFLAGSTLVAQRPREIPGAVSFRATPYDAGPDVAPWHALRFVRERSSIVSAPSIVPFNTVAS